MEGFVMETVSSADFQRRIGHFQDRALVEPVLVTRNGRERVVLISADEFKRLKRLDREALPVSALSDAELAAIAAAEVPAEYAHLDDELRG
jgi:prevent-host-death family protein